MKKKTSKKTILLAARTWESDILAIEELNDCFLQPVNAEKNVIN